MSNTLYAFISKDKVPNSKEWQSSLDKIHLGLTIDSQLTPFDDSGYCPCKLNGIESGFEIYYDNSEEIMSELNLDVPKCEICISFNWGSDIRECCCAMIAAYSLAIDFGASISFEGDGIYTIDNLKKEMLNGIASI